MLYLTRVTKIFSNFDEFCILLAKMTKISTFFKFELHASYVHQKKAKIIQKLVLNQKSIICSRKIHNKMILSIFDLKMRWIRHFR